MSSASSILETWFPQPYSKPAVAAAVTMLAGVSLPPLPDRMDRALRAVAPHLTDAEVADWTTALSGSLPKAGIAGPRCVAAFLGQCAFESAGFRKFEEDLSYTAGRLCQVWPNRFPNAEAAETCAQKPEVLANRVYADRMGNGGPASGDGWRFRGRGLIQITGRAAYEQFAQTVAMTLDQATEHAATSRGAVDCATWFWSANRLNSLANIWSLDLITRKINGGLAGAAERNRLCEAALHALGA
jgi:putative chitinase